MTTYMKKVIIRNSAGCFLCGDAIESKSVHDYVTCKCGNLSVDGGHEYLKRGVMKENIDGKPTYIDLSQIDLVEENA